MHGARIWLALAGIGIAVTASQAFAQSTPPSCPVINGVLRCGSGGDDRYDGPTLDGILKWIFKPPRKAAPSQGVQQNANAIQATALNDRGNEAAEAGNWATAQAYYEQALQLWPKEPTITKNLQNVLHQQALLAIRAYDYGRGESLFQYALSYGNDPEIASALADMRRMAEENRKKQKAAANLGNTFNNLSKTIEANPSGGQASSGLEFGDPTKQPAAKPAPVEPPTVDARNVPSGLPRSVEDSIPHTPAGDRTRKGFQAIQDHDWKVARAWFQDALLKEPNNDGLKRLVELSEYMVARQGQPAGNAKQPPLPASLNRPIDPAVRAQYDRDWKIVKAMMLAPPVSQDEYTTPPDLLAKVVVAPDGSRFAPGPALDRDAVRQVADGYRMEAQRFRISAIEHLSKVNGNTKADLDEFTTGALQAHGVEQLTAFANEVERCKCAPIKIVPRYRSAYEEAAAGLPKSDN